MPPLNPHRVSGIRLLLLQHLAVLHAGRHLLGRRRRLAARVVVVHRVFGGRVLGRRAVVSGAVPLLAGLVRLAAVLDGGDAGDVG